MSAFIRLDIVKLNTAIIDAHAKCDEFTVAYLDAILKHRDLSVSQYWENTSIVHILKINRPLIDYI